MVALVDTCLWMQGGSAQHMVRALLETSKPTESNRIDRPESHDALSADKLALSII